MLAFYRDRLASYGVVNPPDLESLWNEHRRAVHWAFYCGWLTCPTANYGWELLVLAHLRTAAAHQDLETRQAIAQIL